MAHADARAFCPQLQSQPANLRADQWFQTSLARWATRFCPWVGLDGRDGLMLDITGSSHLWGGETALLDDIRQSLARLKLSVRLGLADTRCAAWALAHYGEGIAGTGTGLDEIAHLPVASLQLQSEMNVSLQRLGLRSIADLAKTPRPSLTRRFGPDLLMRLDQASGDLPETISPLREPAGYAVRITLPEPIGLSADVMEGTSRLLKRLCEKLTARQMGAQAICLTLRRVDQNDQKVELRLAQPLRDPVRILRLLEPGISKVDAGFGIDQLRLEAIEVKPSPAHQMNYVSKERNDGLDDLITRVGVDTVLRFVPSDSHIPERSFSVVPAVSALSTTSWTTSRLRPARLFPPEVISGVSPKPPKKFMWRNMALTIGRATGPERIAPEWWLKDKNWRSGLRDYWRVETCQGRRLWLFFTPQNPAWYVHGEFL